MAADLIPILQRLGRPRVLVVGDVMLDRYIWGNAERISQEAPVILLRADRREERLGGAGSVSMMLSALEACPSLVGVVGNDVDAEHVRALLDQSGVDASGVLTDSGRPTTVKERYIGRAQARHPQQMLRVDYEVRDAVTGSIEDRLCEMIMAKIAECEIVLVSDYDKGVCTPRIIETTVKAAKTRGIRVVADPIRGSDYRKYHGVSAITPNRLEAGLAVGRTLTNNGEAFHAGAELQQRLGLEAAIITLDKDGMALCQATGATVFPTRPRQVYDITGAGDMVMAMLGLTLAAGVNYPEAIRLANVAGGLEVEKIGVATVSREEILHDLLHASSITVPHSAPSKILSLPSLLIELEHHRRNGRTVAFTNGCFDVLHAGHVQYLREARSQADVLVVGLNSDASVRGLKGEGRPVNPIEARSAVLAGLEVVNYLTIFDEPTPLRLIEAVCPEVLVKGADYRKEEVVGAEFVERHGGRVHLAGLRDGFSTTDLIRKMKAA